MSDTDNDNTESRAPGETYVEQLCRFNNEKSDALYRANETARQLRKERDALKAKWAALQRSIDPLMCIVEGCMGERWAAGSRRLVDTTEWCVFYSAWKNLDGKKTK